MFQRTKSIGYSIYNITMKLFEIIPVKRYERVSACPGMFEKSARVASMADKSHSRFTIALNYFLWLWYFIYNSLYNIIYLKEVYIYDIMLAYS